MNTVTESSDLTATDGTAPLISPVRARTSGTVPAPMAAPAPAPSPGKRPGRSAIKIITLGALAIAAAVWLGKVVWHTYHYEKTDNAYIVGHIHQISAQSDGQVQAVLVQDNQTVKAGEPLVRLDPLEFEIAVQKARAALAQADAQQTQAAAAIPQTEAQTAEAQARVAQAHAQINQAKAQLYLARLTFDRTDKLFGKNGAVTQADLDNARSSLQAAEASQGAAQANFTAAEASVRSTQEARASAVAQVDAAKANVAVAATAVRDAERKLSYATVTAPADGRVGNRAVEAGNRVQAGQALFSLTEPDVWVVANFKETQLARMRFAMIVDMTIDALPEETLHGKIDSLAPASGAQFALLPPDNATGNFNKVVQRVPVKIAFAPADLQRLGDRLRLGLSVVVDIRVR